MSHSENIHRRHGHRWIRCVHCGQDDWHGAFGLCRACYVYQHRTGWPRPLVWPSACCVCGGPLGHTQRGAICDRCYHAAWRRGMLAHDVYAAVAQGAREAAS